MFALIHWATPEEHAVGRPHLLSLYRAVDVAFKAVDTGSVELHGYCIYFEGDHQRDQVYLQMDEAVSNLEIQDMAGAGLEAFAHVCGELFELELRPGW